MLDFATSYTQKHGFIIDHEAELALREAEDKAKVESASRANDSYRTDPHAIDYIEPHP